MKLKMIILSLVLILTSCSSSDTASKAAPALDLKKKPEISQKDVSRVIKTLAADDMEGRMIFTPGIKKASDFLVNEFKTIGLEPLEGASGYTQDFVIYDMKVESQSVTINEKSYKDENYFFLTGSKSVMFDNVTDIIVETVGPEETINKARALFAQATKNMVIFVDQKHGDVFARYNNYFGRGTRTMEMKEGPSALVVLGAPVELKSIKASLMNSITEQPLNNVAGMIKGKRSDEFVLFSAHYDHVGIRKTAGTDSIFNGANDDASGTTAVVELARYFKQMDKPERSILFVAFTAEESGGYGSKYFSQKLNPDQIIAMFNIEMIGKPATDGPNSCWITGFERSSFGTILQNAVKGTKFKFYPDPYPSQNLFYRSDNATLARLGVPAHSLSTTPIDVDPDYHKATDHVETIDMAHMTNTIKAIAAGARTIISGEATPTRVDKSKVN